MKRAEKEVLENEVEKKAKKDVFSEIPTEIQKQISQAVEHAVKPDSKQPIILQVMGMDEPGQNDYEFAYWPASQDVGERLMKTLVLLRTEDVDRHAALIFLLDDDMDEELDDFYKPYFSGKVKKLSDLGHFKKLSHWDRGEEEEGEEYCTRSSLDTFLYFEQCYV